ncbi:MAG TPA: divalent-cation tolerance protein CutA [Candidatus Acidoferrales bacterium]|nr:divalent-cation tolerance protein CutA [Candidatus Acidoferrales bacterium]
MNDGERAVLLLVTAGGRDEAERLGEGLVTRRLAACGTVIPMVHSFYFWEGGLKRDHEALLLVKTSAARAEAAITYVREHHSYELPEVLQLGIEGGSAPYLEWLLKEVGETPGST